jgi:hypothetical protein
MDDVDIKLAIVQCRWRVWHRDSSFSLKSWIVQRRTWYGGWKTIGSFYTGNEAIHAKQRLIKEDLITFQGNLSELI